jgi:hypothetical protein
MDALLAKIQVFLVHPQQLTEPKSAFFEEHQADQLIAKDSVISLWGTSIADGLHKDLEHPAWKWSRAYVLALSFAFLAVVSGSGAVCRPTGLFNAYFPLEIAM